MQFIARTLVAISVMGLAAFAVNSAQAAVVDFEDLGVAIGTQVQTGNGVTTTTGGFDVDTGNTHIHLHNQDGFGDNGTTNAGLHGLINLAPTAGGAFSLLSFDFDYFIADLGTITLNALTTGGVNISQIFTTDGIPSVLGGASSYETFAALGFSSIVGATILSGAPNISSTNGFFVDNFVVGAAVAAIPIPAALPLLGSGLGLLGLLGWRRKRKAAA